MSVVCLWSQIVFYSCATLLKIVTYNVSGDVSPLSMVTNCVLQLCYTVENCYLQCFWGCQSSVYGHKLCFTDVILEIVTYNVFGDVSRLSLVTNCVLQLCYTVENCYLQCIWGCLWSQIVFYSCATLLKIVIYNVSGDVSPPSMVTNCVLQLCYTVENCYLQCFWGCQSSVYGHKLCFTAVLLKIVTYNVFGDVSCLSMVTNCVLQLCYTVENCYLQCFWGCQSSVYGHKLCFTALLHY